MRVVVMMTFTLHLAYGRIFTASPNGNSLAACVAALSKPGDECRLASGTYHAEPAVAVPPLVGTAESPIVIGAAPGATVLIDGTTPLAVSTWTKNGSAWTGTLAAGATEPTQLWLDGEMMTPARWPNALWSDRSIFNWTNLSTFDDSKPWAPSHYTPHSTKPMTFYDSGALARARVSIAGAMFIGNVAHMDTFVGRVTAHESGSNAFDVVIDVDKFGNSKASNSIFFVEGTAELVDNPGEWAYSPASRVVTVMTPDGAAPDAGGRSVRTKAQVYALNVTSAAHLTVANLSFLGTTIHARGRIPHMRWESLVFDYPSFSRRMLGDPKAAAPTTLVAEAGGAPGPSPPGPSPSTGCTDSDP